MARLDLESMLHRQAQLQQAFDPRAVSDDPQESCEYIKDMVLAMTAEGVELLEETGWKPWSSSWHINTEAARGEWIDAFHFLLNLANKLGMTELMIAEMYHAKADINFARMENGYDGVSTKCPQCKRALDDPAVKCHLPKDDPYIDLDEAPGRIPMGWCEKLMQYYS